MADIVKQYVTTNNNNQIMNNNKKNNQSKLLSVSSALDPQIIKIKYTGGSKDNMDKMNNHFYTR